MRSAFFATPMQLLLQHLQVLHLVLAGSPATSACGRGEPLQRNCCANASSWVMQVFQPSKNPICSWRSRVVVSGCMTVAT